MTAFATSWRRAERALLLPLLLGLGACAGPQPTDTAAEPPPVPGPPPAAPAPPAAGSAAGGQAPAGAGLVPLPTPGAVVASVPLGRNDPFGEVLPRPAVAGAARPPGRPSTGAAVPGKAAEAMPEDFRLAGVMRSGGRSAAVVQFGGQSGSVRHGDRGGISTDLLPPGWSVAAIDVNRGSLTLQRGRRVFIAEL